MLKRGQLIRTLSLVALSGAMACVSPRPRVGVVYVAGRPPVDRVEVIAVAPGPAHVWIGGHWAWRGAEYVWIPGHWEMPGAGFRAWVPGHWAHDRFGWYWIEGHWR
jgi:hypothetical protein